MGAKNIMSLLPYGAYARGYGYPGYGYPGAYPYGPYGMTSDEIAKIREAEEKAFQEAEEKRKEFMEAEKKKYEDYVAAQKKAVEDAIAKEKELSEAWPIRIWPIRSPILLSLLITSREPRLGTILSLCFP